jgi:hypothetical protein
MGPFVKRKIGGVRKQWARQKKLVWGTSISGAGMHNSRNARGPLSLYARKGCGIIQARAEATTVHYTIGSN